MLGIETNMRIHILMYTHIYRRPCVAGLDSYTCNHTTYNDKQQVDRLVNQSYQNWAPRVQEAAYGQTPGAVTFTTLPEGKGRGAQYALRPTTVRCVRAGGVLTG